MQPPDYILVVEDNPDLADVEVLMLQSAGYQVESAANGARALECVEDRMPSLILLDMLMPVMDGWAFAREFRHRYGDRVPIIVVTAAEQAQVRAAEIGAQGVLSKPFDVDDLRQVVEHFRPRPPEPVVHEEPHAEI